MNENTELIEAEEIQNLIYTIRGKQVMLDSDVAMLYHYETKEINKAANRNIERFPENFRFRLTVNEPHLIKKFNIQYPTLKLARKDLL